MKRKVSAPLTGAAPAPEATTHGGGRVFVEGQVVRMRPDGWVVLRMANGREVPCRRPSTIDRGWLRTALAVGPLHAEGTMDLDRGMGSIWCVFPGLEHEDVAAPTLNLVATERLTLHCGKSSLTLEKDGALQVRGRDVLTRGSRSARLSGATVRIN